MAQQTGGMIAIKEEKMDYHSLTQGRSQARLSALVEVCHEDSSMMQMEFGRLEESLENESPLKPNLPVRSARQATWINVNTQSNNATERTPLSPARQPDDPEDMTYSLQHTMKKQMSMV